MTPKKFFKLYDWYKKDYDFKLSKRPYAEIDEENRHEGEFLPD